MRAGQKSADAGSESQIGRSPGPTEDKKIKIFLPRVHLRSAFVVMYVGRVGLHRVESSASGQPLLIVKQKGRAHQSLSRRGLLKASTLRRI